MDGLSAGMGLAIPVTKPWPNRPCSSWKCTLELVIPAASPRPAQTRWQDGNATLAGIADRYERELGNDLGNLLSRTTAMIARSVRPPIGAT